jgi:hypothetical protein
VTNELQPQDQSSGLVERSWQRKNRGGVSTERTMEGQHVKAAWLDETGQVQRAAGQVVRNEDGQLVLESFADGVRSESAVPRDANVDLTRR